MEGQDISIVVAKYKKTTWGIEPYNYTGIISECALCIIMDALRSAASTSGDYYKIAKFVRLHDNIKEQRSQSMKYADRGEWGEEIK